MYFVDCRSIENKLENAEREAKYLRHENAMSSGGRGPSGATGVSGPEREELVKLRGKVLQLQDDLNAKLKSQYENASSKLELTATSEELKSRLQETQRALVQKAQILESNQVEVAALNQRFVRQEEELNIFRKESERLREENLALSKKNENLLGENTELINRIMEEKRKISEQVNDMNEMRRKSQHQSDLLRRAGKAPNDGSGSGPGEGTGKKSSQWLAGGSVSNMISNFSKTVLTPGPASSGSRRTGPVDSGPGRHATSSSAASAVPSRAVQATRAHDGAEIFGISYNQLDSRCLATCASDGTVKLWSSANLKRNLGMLRSSGGALMDLDWSGNLLVAGSTDTSVHLWDVTTQRVKHKMTGHRGKVISVKFIESGKQCITGSSDRSIKIWDVRTGYVTRTIDCASVCNCVDLGPDEVTLVSAHQDANVRVWDIRSGARTHEVRDVHKMPVAHVEFSKVVSSMTSNLLVSTCRDNTVRVFDALSFEPVRDFTDANFRVPTNTATACISPDGSYCCAGSGTGSVHVWDISNGNVVQNLKKHGSAVHACTWRADGQQVATVDKKGYCVLWE
eukprot:g5173.t1